jgi:hypothetical protein
MLALLAFTTTVTAKRKAPVKVAPLIMGKIKYMVPQEVREIGQNLGGMFMQAFDAKTGAILWELPLYVINYKKGLEKDVQDIFISRMEIQDQNLIIWNERKDKFLINLKTREVLPPEKVYNWQNKE